MKLQSQDRFQNYEEQQQHAAQNDAGWKTFLVTGTAGLSAYIVVDLNSDGSISAAANGVKGIGVLQESVGFTTPTAYGRVKLWSAPGTFDLQVSGTAVTPGTNYSVITGGYAGTATGTLSGTNPPWFRAIGSGVASNGIVVEFATDVT